ncbi:MAG TPA: hypothetical protein ENH70_03025 [Desulfobacteraceae bacterium]|nr:MAG: hypothetical protein DRG82_13010 [Deltaproteobacteria bacterium]HDZ23494.1 hypothetical protein [Desulfobacteraceae bacterium]
MEITCEHCKTTLNIPDEKIPKGQKISATCPKCREKLTIDTRKGRDREGRMSGPSRSSDGDAGAISDYLAETEEDALEYYEEGVKLALVLGEDEEQRSKIEKHLDAMGFSCVLADDTRKGIGKMRLHHFDLVIFPEDFGGVALDQSPILHFLNHLSMSVRRRMFVVVIGEHFKTMDQMMAFALSVNLVVNRKDLGRLSMVMQRAISQNERFYKVFMEIYRETGRA